MSKTHKPIVMITGAGGNVGQAIIRAIGSDYRIVCLDKEEPSFDADFIPVDLTDDDSVRHAFLRFRDQYGDGGDHGARIASVLHLAAYFDFTGQDNSLYEHLNIDGTRRLLRELQSCDVGQFVYSGTMLVHASVTPGERIDESGKLDPKWIYPKSKAQAEEVIRRDHGDIPYVLLHIAGLYDDDTIVPAVAHQIARIYERDLESHVYSGDLDAGRAMVHKDDLASAFRLTIDRREALPPEATILIGEPDPIGYGALQDQLGELLFGRAWMTLRVPASIAAAGAAIQDVVQPHLSERLGGGREPFLRPYMMTQASDHYALDVTRARDLLGWEPGHRLADTLPTIVATLKRDPVGWYKANKLDPARILDRETNGRANG